MKTDKTIDVTPFLRLQNCLKLLHWKARKHGEHVALGDAYEAMDDKIDEFIECFLGSYLSVQWDCYEINCDIPQDEDSLITWRKLFNEFNGEVMEYCEENAALASIRDDMEAISDRLCYLLKMD